MPGRPRRQGTPPPLSAGRPAPPGGGTPPPVEGLTLRSLVLGLAMVLVVAVGAPYSIWMVGSSGITWSYFPIGVGAPLVGLVLVNALLRRLAGVDGLQPAELVVIVSMGLVTTDRGGRILTFNNDFHTQVY